MLAGVGLVIAAITPRRGMGIAAIVTVLMMLAMVQGIGGEIANELDNEGAQTYVGLASPYTLVDGITSGVFDTSTPVSGSPDGVLQIGVFGITALLIIVLCFGALVLRYRRVSVS